MKSENKKTLVIGASTNTSRYSYLCVQTLKRFQVPVVALGLREGEIESIPILIGKPVLDDIHTVSLYIGKSNQESYQDYVLSLKPKRVIFNPGTENPEFEKKLVEAHIEAETGCTIIMLQSGVF